MKLTRIDKPPRYIRVWIPRKRRRRISALLIGLWVCVLAAAVTVGLLLAHLGRVPAVPPSRPSAPAASAAAPAAVTPSAAPRPSASLLEPSGKLLGVAAPGAGWAPIAAWAASTGSTPNLVETFAGWGQDLPDTSAAWAHHALTLISWGSDTTTLPDIAAGSDDAYITRVATQVRAAGHPIAIDADHEFNGDWYPWGAGGAQHATAAQFVAAWRHLHDVFARAGALNAIWVWSPNVVNPLPDVSLAPYWPGAAYVDWAGLVGYWTPSPAGQHTWNSLYAPTERQIRALTGDPILITEAGAQQGPGKAGWVTAMLHGLKADAHMIGLVYFDYGLKQRKRADWTLTDDSAAVSAYRATAATIPLQDIP